MKLKIIQQCYIFLLMQKSSICIYGLQYNISIEQRMDLQMTGLFAAETGQLFRVALESTHCEGLQHWCAKFWYHTCLLCEACATHFYDPLVAIYETASSSGVDTKTSISYTCAKRTISSHMYYELFGICQLFGIFAQHHQYTRGAMTNYSLLPLFCHHYIKFPCLVHLSRL